MYYRQWSPLNEGSHILRVYANTDSVLKPPPAGKGLGVVVDKIGSLPALVIQDDNGKVHAAHCKRAPLQCFTPR
jgi:hypothetical protein